MLANFDFSMEPDEKNKKVPNRRITMAADQTGMVQTRRRNKKNTKATERTDDLDADSDDDSAEIERRVKALQRLVPGGENMGVEALFEVTADYIEELRAQVTMMRSLADFIDAVAREKRLVRR